MMFFRTHRKGVTSVLALVAAGLLPGPVQGEVALAQIVPEAAQPAEIRTVEPAVDVATVQAPAKDDAKKQTKPEKGSEILKVYAEGMASYYGAELAGNRTASGERFNPSAMTAAHRFLPLGTRLKVTNKANGKSVIVRVNDRGPFAKARILDLSKGAAEKISMVRSGTARVTIAVLR